MNSASRGLRPTVGLRRPKSVPCVGGGRRLARKRLEGPISIGTKAFGQWSACAPNEFGLEGPSASGRPVPTEKRSLRRRRPTPGAQRLEGPISIGTKAFGRRSACADREGVLCVGGGRRLARSAVEGRFQSAQKPSADGRPAPTEKRSLRRRRPTPGAQRLEGPISIGTKAFGQRSACADRKAFPASAEADAWRGVCRMNSASRGLRPTVGLRRPKSVPCVGA
jgi:hypothetical protein